MKRSVKLEKFVPFEVECAKRVVANHVEEVAFLNDLNDGARAFGIPKFEQSLFYTRDMDGLLASPAEVAVRFAVRGWRRIVPVFAHARTLSAVTS